MRRSYITILGFLLLATGVLSLCLSLVGVELSFLTWLNSLGLMGSFLARIAMIMLGLILLYFSKTSTISEQES